jgi:hypothetical protein
MHKKLLVPVAFMALTSVGLRAMEAEKTVAAPEEKAKQEVTGLEELAPVGDLTFEEFQQAYPDTAAIALVAYKQNFMKRMQQKDPNLVSKLRTKAQTRGGLNDALEGAVSQVQTLQSEAATAMATAGVLAELFKDVTGVDVKATAAEVGEDLKGLVQQGFEALSAQLDEANQTGCWGRCKKKKPAPAPAAPAPVVPAPAPVAPAAAPAAPASASVNE